MIDATRWHRPTRGLLALATSLATVHAYGQALPPRPVAGGNAAIAPSPLLGVGDAAAGATPEVGDAAAAPPPRAGLRIEPFVDARVSWTSNGNFNEAGSAPKQDVIGELRPGFDLRYDAARLHALGRVALDAVDYVNGSQVNRVLPQGSLDASLEAVEHRLYLDGGVRAYQTAENAFQVRSIGTSTYNQYTTIQSRLSPHLEGQLPSELTYLVRSDNTWTASSGSTVPVPQGYFGRQAARLDRRPLPVGGSLQYEYDSTDYTNNGSTALTQQLVRLVVEDALLYDLVVEARGGYESDRFSIGKSNKAIYGTGLAWRPTERTDLVGYWEKHDYAGVWDARFSHRMPRLAFSIASSRGLTTYAESVFAQNGVGSIAGLLDAALTTRVTDPAERALLVRQLVDRQGLSSTLATPTDVVTEGFQLAQNNSASIAILGVRDTYTLSGYWSKTLSLLGPNTVAGASTSNVTQQGASLSAAHRWSAVTTLNVTLAWNRTRGLDALAANASRQNSLQLEVLRQLSAKTTAVFGARRQLLTSNVVSSTNETAAFAGLNHRF